jgi:uncharacterized integral membrane protein
MRWLLFLPLAGVVALFALSNRDPVSLRLWPFEPSLQMPLGIAVLLAAAAGFLLGAVIVWLSDLPARSRSRAAQRRAASLERELDGLRARERSDAADRLAGRAT